MNKKCVSFFIKSAGFLTLFCVTISLFSQEPPDSALNGKVSYVSTAMYMSKYQTINKEKLESFSKEQLIYRRDLYYDTAQLLTKDASFNRRNSEETTIINKYDANGKLSEQLELAYRLTVTKKTTFLYHPNGNLKQSVDYDASNAVKGSVYYTYNAQNQILTKKTYNSIHLLLESLEYQYDSNGNVIMIKNIPTINKENIPYQIENQYDTKNRLICERKYDKNNVLETEYLCVYNSKTGLLQYEITKNIAGDTVFYTQYTYDRKNRIASKFQLNPLKPTIRRTNTFYTYNKQNQCVTISVYLLYNTKKPDIVKKYFYDDHGNWQAWIEQSNEELKIVSQRKITYL
ncbi:MAG: hypothetical protein LBR36_08880 [Bacteroidales bacterium]|jgi:hypothetical protein|nr:hypothetical protein [Bacteroidales bacterium]